MLQVARAGSSRWPSSRRCPGSAAVASWRERGQPSFPLEARTPGFTVPRQTGFAPGWSPVGADSLQVLAWADGTSIVVFFLRRREGGALRGTARYFTDGVILDPTTRRWMWEAYPVAPASLEPSRSGVPGGHAPGLPLAAPSASWPEGTRP